MKLWILVIVYTTYAGVVVISARGMGNMRLVRLRPVRLGPRVICV